MKCVEINLKPKFLLEFIVMIAVVNQQGQEMKQENIKKQYYEEIRNCKL